MVNTNRAEIIETILLVYLSFNLEIVHVCFVLSVKYIVTMFSDDSYVLLHSTTMSLGDCDPLAYTKQYYLHSSLFLLCM